MFMNQIDQKYTSIGLLTHKFEAKFKKILLFLETLDNPSLFFQITCFMDVQDLLKLLSTCKKFMAYKNIVYVENRLLRQKIRILQSPKQTMKTLCLLPAYYMFLNQKKDQTRQLANNTRNSILTLQQYNKIKNMLKKRKQLFLNMNEEKKINKFMEQQRKEDLKISQIQKSIMKQQPNIYEPIKLSKQPIKKQNKNVSFVQKFRDQYNRMKQFQRKKNIRDLQELHERQKNKVKIRRQIKTPFKTIPIVEFQQNEKINVVNIQPFSIIPSQKIKRRLKVIFGFPI